MNIAHRFQCVGKLVNWEVTLQIGCIFWIKWGWFGHWEEQITNIESGKWE